MSGENVQEEMSASPAIDTCQRLWGRTTSYPLHGHWRQLGESGHWITTFWARGTTGRGSPTPAMEFGVSPRETF